MTITSQLSWKSSTPAGLTAGLALVLASWAPADACSGAEPEAACDRVITSIRVTGNQRTLTRVILREMETQIGECYDPEKVREDRDRIDNLNLFSEVGIDTLAEGKRVEIEILVKERLIWVPTEWIPYPILRWDEDNGWSYGGGLTNPNTSGRNRSFSAAIEGGGRKVASFSYADPWVVGNHGSASLSFYFSESKNVEGQTNRLTSGRLGFGSYLGTSGRAFISFRTSEIETDHWRTVSETRRDQLRSVVAGLALDTRDVYADPRRGWYAGASLRITRPVWKGTVDNTRAGVQVSHYRSLGSRQTLASSLSLAVSEGLIPDYHMLRLGGRNQVRGIDPSDLEGRNRVLASIEHRIRIIEKKSYNFWFVTNVDLGLAIALFGDVGAVWDKNEIPGLDEFYGAAGAGIRLLSQNPLRLELAYSRRDGVFWILEDGIRF